MQRTSFLLVSLLACASFACGDAAPASPGNTGNTGSAGAAAPELELPPGAPLVVVIGDSVAAGLHLPAHEAWPAVLQRLALERGAPFRLVNAGVSGDTTAGGRSRLPWLLSQEPDLLVIELGHNDGLRGVPIASVAENLNAMLETATRAGPRVLLLGVRLPPNLGSAYVSEFEALYPTLAERHGALFLPYFMEGVGGVPELNLPDGLHPTAEGHERLARNVLPAILSALLPADTEPPVQPAGG